MIGALNSTSLSVLSAQQMQAQRDAQTARARAERLQVQSQQAAEDARRATQRSDGLDRQSRAYAQVADQAQQRADSQPTQSTLPAPSRSENTAPTSGDDPLPPQGLTTAQQVGRSVLNQFSSASGSPTAAVRTYQQVQASSGVSAGNSVQSAPAPTASASNAAASLRISV